jgi:hypothetical protein
MKPGESQDELRLGATPLINNLGLGAVFPAVTRFNAPSRVVLPWSFHKQPWVTAMQGTVKGISANKQRIAVITDYGYTVFDIEDGEVESGDVISGYLNEHGSQVLTNQTTGHKLYVYVEAIGASRETAISLLSRL